VHSGADAIVVDLEDAVPAIQKGSARDGLADFLKDVALPVFVRVNAVDTEWFNDDMAFVRNTPVAGVMLAKTQSAEDIAAVGSDIAVIGLIETALGVISLPNICRAANLKQLAFGSIDYALDVGCVETREALLLARLSIVTQSRACGLAAPLDGVTVSVTDQEMVQSDAEYAMGLGFGGKLVIHPKQIDIVMAAMRPSANDLDWARSVCAVDEASGGAAVLLDGRMIDAPVIKKARQILSRAGTR
jgi:citrate lyase subunit beta/citryl-CoA lyase